MHSCATSMKLVTCTVYFGRILNFSLRKAVFRIADCVVKTPYSSYRLKHEKCIDQCMYLKVACSKAIRVIDRLAECMLIYGDG